MKAGPELTELLAHQRLHQLGGPGVGAPHEAGDDDAARAQLANRLHVGGDKGLEDRLHAGWGVAHFGFDAVQAGQPLSVGRFNDAVQDRLQQLLLGAEVVVDRRQIHFGHAGNFPKLRWPRTPAARTAFRRRRGCGSWWRLWTLQASPTRFIQTFILMLVEAITPVNPYQGYAVGARCQSGNSVATMRSVWASIWAWSRMLPPT